jgi:hypothetical protein
MGDGPPPFFGVKTTSTAATGNGSHVERMEAATTFMNVLR